MNTARPRLLTLFVAIAAMSAHGRGLTADGPRDDHLEAWNQFLDDPQVFGEYVDVSLDGSSLARVRRLIYETVPPGEDPGAQEVPRRRAARALWVGTNLEYQAMLSAADSPAPAAPTAGAPRDHAWRALALAQRLRRLLARTPLVTLEDKEENRDLWEEALLRLAAIEAEAENASPVTKGSLRDQVRAALVAEFSPDQLAVGSPNALVISSLRVAFVRTDEMAKASGFALGQASLALGKVYGYPPQLQRSLDWPLLGPERQEAGAQKGLYPSADPRAWQMVAATVLRSYGGGVTSGIVGLYAAARQPIVGRSAKDLLADVAASDIHPGYPEESDLHVAYALDELKRLAARSREPVAARAPVEPGVKVFGEFGIAATGETDDGGIKAYADWLKRRMTGKTVASKEFADLKARKRPTPDPEALPLDDTTFGHLVEVAHSVLGKDGASDDRAPNSTRFVRDALNEWLRSQIEKQSLQAKHILDGEGKSGEAK